MNEEEEKAIKTIEEFRDYYAREDIHKEDFNNNQSYEKALSEIRQLRNNFDTVLNLITKLQKENEKLKNKLSLKQFDVNIVYNDYLEELDKYKRNTIPVQKVKNKIEELNRKIDKSIDNSKGGLDEEFIEKAGELLTQKRILQELLEESDNDEEKKAIENAKWCIHQMLARINEDIADYIDDDKEKNRNIIGELKETKKQWQDVEKLLNGENKDKLYNDWSKYGEYE